ncbi:MAG: hypothetical protein LUC26_08025 [Prevotella sp.]|nr:hypothetical protein [Prevotella sp.]
MANNEEKSAQLSQTPPANISPSQFAKKQNSYSKAITNGFHHSVRNLVRAAGGREKVSQGASRALGHSGVAVAGAFVNAFAEINKKGLNNWLQEKGFGEHIGKSCSDILDCMRKYLATEVVGMDDTAANEALEYVLEDFGQKIDQDAKNFDEVMHSTMSSAEINSIIDNFFGMYIFSHLSQDFQEKLEHDKGTAISSSTMDDIRELILDDVRKGFKGRSSANIDWAGEEGESFIKHEFDKIIYILSGDED